MVREADVFVPEERRGFRAAVRSFGVGLDLGKLSLRLDDFGRELVCGWVEALKGYVVSSDGLDGFGDHSCLKDMGTPSSMGEKSCGS